MNSIIKQTTLKDTSNSNWADKVLANGSTTYTAPLPFFYTDGFTALLIKTDESITITFQVSVDKENWYAPYDINGTVLDEVVATLSTDRWVIFYPQIAGYMRFKVVANAEATTSLTLIQKKKEGKL